MFEIRKAKVSKLFKNWNILNTCHRHLIQSHVNNTCYQRHLLFIMLKFETWKFDIFYVQMANGTKWGSHSHTYKYQTRIKMFISAKRTNSLFLRKYEDLKNEPKDIEER